MNQYTITAKEAKLLEAIYDAGGTTAVAAAVAARLLPSEVASAVDHLAKKGLLEVRDVALHLTDAGQAVGRVLHQQEWRGTSGPVSPRVLKSPPSGLLGAIAGLIGGAIGLASAGAAEVARVLILPDEQEPGAVVEDQGSQASDRSAADIDVAIARQLNRTGSP